MPPGAHSHEHEHEETATDPEAEEEELVSIDMRQRRLELEGEWRHPVDSIQAVRLKASHSDYRHAELEGEETGTVFTNEGYDLRL
ncbi:MAG: hypothetical protein J6386_10190 [Candidatus Synoicihabitans palmerolidicus]|nr:hypothetical protein [Candidatus Synoicihabitans palmerolidicus]